MGLAMLWVLHINTYCHLQYCQEGEFVDRYGSCFRRTTPWVKACCIYLPTTGVYAGWGIQYDETCVTCDRTMKLLINTGFVHVS